MVQTESELELHGRDIIDLLREAGRSVPDDAAVTFRVPGGEWSYSVICENGGALSHLAVEGRASGFRVVVVPDTRRLFPVGSRVRVDVGAGTVEIVEGPTP